MKKPWQSPHKNCLPSPSAPLGSPWAAAELPDYIIAQVLGACAAAGFGGMAIGLYLTLIHLICIPVTNTSVNPARSTGPAMLAPSWALGSVAVLGSTDCGRGAGVR